MKKLIFAALLFCVVLYSLFFQTEETIVPKTEQVKENSHASLPITHSVEEHSLIFKGNCSMSVLYQQDKETVYRVSCSDR